MIDCWLSLSSTVVVLCGHRLTEGFASWPHGASRGSPDICQLIFKACIRAVSHAIFNTFSITEQQRDLLLHLQVMHLKNENHVAKTVITVKQCAGAIMHVCM